MNISQLIEQLDNGNHLEPQEIRQGIKELTRYLSQLERRNNERTHTSEILRDALRLTQPSNIEQLRNAVYGSVMSELIGMQLFIDSRQEWCKQEILTKLSFLREAKQ